MEKVSICPVCESDQIVISSEIKDHFLSGEIFQLTQCSKCGFLFTNPRPEKSRLGKYYQSEDYFSHSKKKKGLITFLYDTIKNYSLKKKFHLINQYKNNGTILDIGCATGEFLHYFKTRGWITFGIEPAEDPRKYAIENYYLDVRPEEAIGEFEEKSFDVISMWHVLEHVPDLKDRIKQIKRLLKNDGLLVIALPNYLSWDGQYYQNYWAGYDVPRHLYHFTEKTISTLLEKFGFSMFKKVPLKFDSFYVSLLSEKYKSGKLNYPKAFFSGVKSNRQAKKQDNNYSSLIYLAKFQNS
jgi:2-polyprenyl-3-methyl-5-hydroxy-6-metoxy-1,4-benzoquinol methylase